MNPTLFEIGVAIFMVAVCAGIYLGKTRNAHADACWRGPRSCRA